MNRQESLDLAARVAWPGATPTDIAAIARQTRDACNIPEAAKVVTDEEQAQSIADWRRSSGATGPSVQVTVRAARAGSVQALINELARACADERIDPEDAEVRIVEGYDGPELTLSTRHRHEFAWVTLW